MTTISEGLSLYSDVTYERRARGFLGKLETTTDETTRKKLVEQYTALRENVSSDVLKKSLPEKSK